MTAIVSVHIETREAKSESRVDGFNHVSVKIITSGSIVS